MTSNVTKGDERVLYASTIMIPQVINICVVPVIIKHKDYGVESCETCSLKQVQPR